MGYGITTTAFYGFHLDDEQTVQLVDCLGGFIQAHPDHLIAQTCQGMEHAPGDVYFDLLEMFETLSELIGAEINMVAEESDSRIHDCTYEPGFYHGFGVVLGASGDYSSRELSDIIQQGPNEQQQQAYVDVIGPWARFAGITDDPYVVMVSNTV